jgi:hypothetical protein
VGEPGQEFTVHVEAKLHSGKTYNVGPDVCLEGFLLIADSRQLTCSCKSAGSMLTWACCLLAVLLLTLQVALKIDGEVGISRL